MHELNLIYAGASALRGIIQFLLHHIGGYTNVCGSRKPINQWAIYSHTGPRSPRIIELGTQGPTSTTQIRKLVYSSIEFRGRVSYYSISPHQSREGHKIPPTLF